MMIMPVELLYSINNFIVNKMLWVGVVNQGTYTSVTDLHNNVHRRQGTYVHISH